VSSAAEAQLAFAAEFVLFLAALAGAAVLVLRASLLVAGRPARWATMAGFVGVGVAAFVHGSLLEADAAAPTIVVPRLVGIVLLGAAALGPHARPGRLPTLVATAALLGAELTVVLRDDPGSIVDVERMVGAVVLTGMLFWVTRASIPARVAAGAAGTVLLVVLAVSMTLSSVVVDNVRDEVLRRTVARAEGEAASAVAAPDAVRVRVTSVGELISRGAADNPVTRDLLVALADQPTSPTGQQAGSRLAVDLNQLGERPDLVGVAGLLAFVTPTGVVVPGTGVPSGSARAQLGFLGVVQDSIRTREVQQGPEILNRELLAVAAAPVTIDTPQGPHFIGAVVSAETLDDSYLAKHVLDDPDLSLAIVGRDGVLASAGSTPSPAVMRAVAVEAMRRGTTSNQATDRRFVAATPVARGALPVAAAVAAAPSRLADQTRQSLFRTLFIVALLATMAAIVLAALIGRRIGQGLRRLTTTAEEIQAGNLDVRAGLDQLDELGVLGTAFDRMAGSLRTMTDELREAAIDEARLRARLEAVVGGMGEALVAVDGEGRVTDFNAAAQELFGRRTVEVRGRPVQRLSIVGPAGEDLAERLSTDPTGAAWGSEATVRRPDGTDVPVVVTGGRLRGPAGEYAGAVVVVRDVRREREVERMKTEFLSNISHEMKTPLTPIKGYAQLLATRDLPAGQAHAFAEEIVVSARQLERVITQLVNFATMAAGRLEPHPAPVPARALVDDVIERWSDRLADGQVLERRVARGTPELLVDRRLVDLSLDELLDNAVKYSPAGGRIVVTAEPGGDGSVLLSVTDRGVGVPADRLETIFAEFAQGDGSSTREYGGLGLGLPMVRHIARAHSGDLTCESVPGTGSTFTLHLPAAGS
jgi:PAS domain S-box-containing protein